MRKLLLPFFAFILCFISQQAIAQCPSCTPDETCVSADGMPAVCPAILPNAVAGSYYEQQLTFFLPAQITDPSSGINATLISVTITSVTGMPYGMEFTLNAADATYYPSSGENYGCATLCGTPLLPGTYSVVITVSALVEALGFQVTQVESFESPLIVDPGQGAVNSFTYDNLAGCGGVQVNYNALVELPEPTVVTYDWDFGNGQQSSMKTPPTVTYDNIGDFSAQLTTTVFDWQLQSVSVASLNDNWTNDEDLFSSPADPYFQISDGGGNLIYSSSEGSNTNSYTWSDVNVALSNPPYNITFFDADDFTADDNLGSAAILLNEGVVTFNAGNGTSGTLNIVLLQTNQFTDSVTVSVFPTPSTNLVQSGDVLSINDPSITSITWYHNNVPIADANNLSYTMTEGGEYYATVSNAFGCSGTTQTILYCPDFDITFDPAASEVSVPDVYDSYQWYFNGLPVEGANQSYLTIVASGNYAVDVTTAQGCSQTSAVLTVNLAVDESLQSNISAFPNPADNTLYLTGISDATTSNIAILDLTGRIVASFPLKKSTQGCSIQIDELGAGVYFAEINHQIIRFVKR